jgi:hypothetical protein
VKIKAYKEEEKDKKKNIFKKIFSKKYFQKNIFKKIFSKKYFQKNK